LNKNRFQMIFKWLQIHQLILYYLYQKMFVTHWQNKSNVDICFCFWIKIGPTRTSLLRSISRSIWKYVSRTAYARIITCIISNVSTTISFYTHIKCMRNINKLNCIFTLFVFVFEKNSFHNRCLHHQINHFIYLEILQL